MTSEKKTLLAICSDRRLMHREQELSNSIQAEEGDFPFRIILPGGCLPYQNDKVLEASFQPFLYAGVNHLHLEDHMGANPLVPSCKAYWLRNMLRYGDQSKLPWQVEKSEHLSELNQIGWSFMNFSERHGYTLTVTAGLYLHDDAGRGKLLPVTIQEPSRYETAFR